MPGQRKSASRGRSAARRFKKAIIERGLGAEMTHPLGYAAGEAKPDDATNPPPWHERHNGRSRGTAIGSGPPSSHSWIEHTEGATFWMMVFIELKVRGCTDLLIAVTDGLKGRSEALEAIDPKTTRQTGLVH